MLRRMQGILRMAHLVVGAIAVVAFLITGMLMSGHDPPVESMEWGERLLFSSRHIYLMCVGLVNLALGARYGLPERPARRGAAIIGSLLLLVSTVLLFFAFFAEPMAGRWPGLLSNLGLFALFWGVVIYVAVSLHIDGRSV
jgi:hypothetical protein